MVVTIARTALSHLYELELLCSRLYANAVELLFCLMSPSCLLQTTFSTHVFAALLPPAAEPKDPAAAAAVWYERAYRALKHRLADGDLIMREYSHIVNLDMFISHSCEAAQQEQTMSLNRYCNVLPYDHNRCGQLCVVFDSLLLHLHVSKEIGKAICWLVPVDVYICSSQ